MPQLPLQALHNTLAISAAVSQLLAPSSFTYLYTHVSRKASVKNFGVSFVSVHFQVSRGCVTSECKLPLAPAHVLSIAPRTRAIDRFSRKRQKPTRALANQNATFHLLQSRCRHAYASKGKFYTHNDV